jgi:hypothetical protein
MCQIKNWIIHDEFGYFQMSKNMLKTPQSNKLDCLIGDFVVLNDKMSKTKRATQKML